MFKRPTTWIVISLLSLAGAYYFWELGEKWAAKKRSTQPTSGAPVPTVTPPAPATVSAATSLLPRMTPTVLAAQSLTSNLLAFRLSNTSRTEKELLRRDHALLLENALIDTETPVDLGIPPHLRAPGDPGSYIVQSRSTLDDAFRARLRDAGATIVAYIPNNAYLVRASAAAAAQLRADAQAVLPFEPYYKLKDSLLRSAVREEPLPDGSGLNVMLFADAAEATKTALQAMGAEIFAEDRSPFGPIVRVMPPSQNWFAVATLPGVQTVEWFRARKMANDLSRVRIGMSANTQSPTNYFGLTGTNVLVSVNDSGVDATHPDLMARIYGNALTDVSGHGTFVAGTIAGTGAVSETVTNARGSINPGVLGQYRGMAPGARILALPLSVGGRPGSDTAGGVSDTYLQETPARTNALISNNSWYYGGAGGYDLAAASYDAASRDALPGDTGSQPVLFVFAAGNDSGITSDSIRSPGTAKNVITVGSLEQPRDITNEVWKCNTIDTNQPVCTTNTPWSAMTSDASEVAGFSSRGNTGVEIEGVFGRFKPDVVAPGTFVVSTRSQQWDEEEYYNPTNYITTTQPDELVAGTNVNYYFFNMPGNAVAMNLTVLSSRGLQIRVWKGKDPATTPDFIKLDNQVTAPPDGGANFGPVNTFWWYAIGNTNATQTNTYTVIRTLTVTNDLGNYYEVLSNLNNSISGSAPHYYRYESGTSMSAAEVSGTLALMQEFFATKLNRTNSPALMKALLINGARAVGNYFMQVRNQRNHQGWGLARVRNSLPGSLTNFNSGQPMYSMWFVDQSPTNALATGESRTYSVRVNNNAGRNQPLRITLVWTDPPGSPAAGVKLVNDLDLIVTNRDDPANPIVYFGNDIPVGSNFTVPWETNSTPLHDLVNNVENAYLFPPLGTNYTVTVRARHVNVNALAAHTNGLVQDYALVISSGDGQVTGALTVANNPVFQSQPDLLVTYVTNTFDNSSGTSRNRGAGFLLDYQRVGANTPLLGTTNGMTNQWHFYVVTNTTSFTNAAFVTFSPAGLSIPRIGVREDRLNNATRIEADVDLYVSTDFNLTNLSPAVVAAANQSRARGGAEQVVLSNAVQGQLYYIGVKSEDQMAAEYSFFGVFSALPFVDADGTVLCFNVPQAIPDRSPDNVQGQINAARVVCPCVLEDEVRRVIVTNSFTHELLTDLIGTLAHGQKFTVLNNHRPPPLSPPPPGPYDFVYEDNDEGNIFPQPPYVLLPSDGPGSLRDFVGEPRTGPWIFTFLDDGLQQTGRVEQVELQVERSLLDDESVERIIAPNSWSYDVINVGVGATNLTVCVLGNTGPLELYLRKSGFPSRTAYDHFLPIVSPGACLTVTRFDLPPLSPGRYFIGIFNPSIAPQTVRVSATVEYDLNGIVPSRWGTDGGMELLDDAITNFTTFVSTDEHIAAAEVGLRIDHPRVSDLAITLISPRGTRVLLFENRGGTNDLGMGNSVYFTNVVPVVITNGGSAAVTNTIPTGHTSGTLTIDYNFFQREDRMTVYYDNVRLLDTGFIGGSGTLTVNYGPGLATSVDIVMNEGGNPDPQTGYDYTVSEVGVRHNYLTFTENTNRTTTPIKFAAPPFINPDIPPAFISGFESAAPGDYVAPAFVEGWSVLSTNRVAVLDDPLLVNTGARSLALLTGEIRTNLATLQGRNYRLDFAFRKSPNMEDPINWWPADGNTVDIVRGFNGQRVNGTSFATGLVAQAYSFDGVDDIVSYSIEGLYEVTNVFTMEFWALPTAARTVTPESNTGIAGSAGQRYAVFPNNGDQDPTGTAGVGVSVGTNGIAVAEHNGNYLPTLLVWDFPVSGWTHIAVVYQNRQPRLYVNGVLVRTGLMSTKKPCPSLRLGGGGSIFSNYGPYRGLVDEYAIFDRVLSAAEIQDIYRAGAAGKCGMIAPPSLCVNAGAQVFVPGVRTNQFTGVTTNWTTNSFIFAATANTTPVGLSPRSEGSSGVFLDDFVLTALPKSLDYLPEESLSALIDESALGQWRLEIWDTRIGAFVNSSLVSWALDLVFQNEVPLPLVLQPGTPRTATIPPGQIAYFLVDVPAVARVATNSLLAATGPVGFYFNQNVPPSPGAANGGDFVFVNGTSGTVEMTPASTPPLIPGQRYHLAVENQNPSNVNYTVLVDFDLRALPPHVTLTDGALYCATNPTPAGLDYYRFTVSTNAVRAQFAILNPSADLTLLLRRELPPTINLFDYVSANPGSNHEVITVFDYSQPVPLSPGDWYMAAANVSGGPVSYCVQANEWFVYGTNITIINTITNTSALCFTWASLPDVLYYVQGTTNGTDWVTISPTIIATDYFTTFCVPLPTPFTSFRVREGVAIDPITLPPVIASIDLVFGYVFLSWVGPGNAQYQVQWKPVLDGTTNWNTFTNIITSPTGLFRFRDDGTQTGGLGPMRFYRLLQLP